MVEKKMTEKKGDRILVRNIRIFQALALGMFTLGLSMMGGEWADFISSPFSTLSITTTMFGFMGSIVCEILARKAEKW